jgi:PAS domain S-box-containing protein
MHFPGQGTNPLIGRLKGMKTYRLWGASVLFSVLLTEAIVVPLSIFFHGRITKDYAVSGFITAFLVSSTIVYVLVRLIRLLREEEERFRCSFETAAIGIALVSLEGRWLKVNRSLCEITGYPEQDLMAMSIEDISHADDIDIGIAYRKSLLSGEFSYFHHEERYIHREGHIVWVFLSVSLVRDSQGKPLFLIAQIENITERKKAEETLRSSESRYKAIVEDQAEFVCRYISGGILTFVNDTLCRYSNMKREDLLGRSFFQFIHKDYLDGLIRDIEALNANNPFTVAEASIVLPDGRVRWHRWNHHAIFNDKGEIVEYQCTGNDVTDLKEAFDNVKKLSGLLPICASCKNILDEKGQWNSLESYISKHSEALFTHGICPECTKTLYPEHYEDIMKRKENGSNDG